MSQKPKSTKLGRPSTKSPAPEDVRKPKIERVPRPRGRPHTYTQAVGDEILARLAKGEFLATICRDEDAPGRATVNRWIRDFGDFRDACAQARAEGAERLLADAASNLQNVAIEDVPRARETLSHTRWLASKLAPKTFGDRMLVEGEVAHTVTLAPMAPAHLRDVTEIPAALEHDTSPSVEADTDAPKAS